ncbi:hypothetical protein M9H77_23108 [Catharanthus roseus]|uniref:Uncharacterized protein n=1 Tax=Catharanthus roseus TaxID=4058 RepID=A0ACC0AU34_CATRO|nr:hypothetical protein M9H77_23108 [Catharanthus roseus]
MNMDITHPVRVYYFEIQSMPEMRMVFISLVRQRKVGPSTECMNNDDKMCYLWTTRPNIAKEGIHIDDLIESGTIRLLDWNDNMTDIQLGMSCDKWREYTLSFSHALSMCRVNGTRPDTYELNIYWRETYKRTYQSNFYLVGHENFGRGAPFNFTFYPPNMNDQRGRKQGTRFWRKWDIEI